MSKRLLVSGDLRRIEMTKAALLETYVAIADTDLQIVSSAHPFPPVSTLYYTGHNPLYYAGFATGYYSALCKCAV